MSPADRIRWLIAPDGSRWIPMFAGLALFAAGAAAAVLLQLPQLVVAVLLVLALAAWFVGVCGMVGYIRWIFATEIQQARRDQADAVEREKHK